MSHGWTLRVLKYFMTSIHGQSSEDLTLSPKLPQSLWYVTASDTSVLLPNVWVVLKYILPFFIILFPEIKFSTVLD